jgi:hypothetical protein
MRSAFHLFCIGCLLGSVLIVMSLVIAAPTLAQDRLRDPASLFLAQQVWLSAHNAARSQVVMATLAWDHDLERHALAWAANLAARGAFHHATDLQDSQQGENLWRGTHSRFAPQDMISAWVAEQRYFRPGIFPEVSSTGQWTHVGHYTQIIWPSTRKVGCAVASNSRDEVLVCRYAPAGNVIGHRL